ncbi:hypothetical protein VTO42DRAFT_2354 [Malbranchea cinnamomea]
MSQKTFKNYLDDEEAALAQAASSGTHRPSVSKAVKSLGPSPRSSGPSTPKPGETKATAATTQQPADASQSQTAPQQPPPSSQQLIVSEFDNDPLLRSYIPSAPSERVMQQLLAEPPLSYNAARATLPPPGPGRKPRRYFCGICGYWGRTKCIKCGARVCGLECYRIHQETRCDRFYA